MSLRTRPIRSAPRESDGLRISIMSRHTLNDGETPDPEITDASFDEWWPELAPPPSLIGAYYKRNLPWVVFEREFKSYLRLCEQNKRLQTLMKLAKNSNATILCIEPTPEFCHRRLVAEACREIDPLLEVLIE